mmetsp:Transcript_30762/g.92158  ORF Transcript_30762/g.92158 Transcript_30762/m.92158 type:complete len:398 (+) Transcript_30762:1911-3104(+)
MLEETLESHPPRLSRRARPGAVPSGGSIVRGRFIGRLDRLELCRVGLDDQHVVVEELRGGIDAVQGHLGGVGLDGVVGGVEGRLHDGVPVQDDGEGMIGEAVGVQLHEVANARVALDVVLEVLVGRGNVVELQRVLVDLDPVPRVLEHLDAVVVSRGPGLEAAARVRDGNGAVDGVGVDDGVDGVVVGRAGVRVVLGALADAVLQHGGGVVEGAGGPGVALPQQRRLRRVLGAARDGHDVGHVLLELGTAGRAPRLRGGVVGSARVRAAVAGREGHVAVGRVSRVRLAREEAAAQRKDGGPREEAESRFGGNGVMGIARVGAQVPVEGGGVPRLLVALAPALALAHLEADADAAVLVLGGVLGVGIALRRRRPRRRQLDDDVPGQGRRDRGADASLR